MGLISDNENKLVNERIFSFLNNDILTKLRIIEKKKLVGEKIQLQIDSYEDIVEFFFKYCNEQYPEDVKKEDLKELGSKIIEDLHLKLDKLYERQLYKEFELEKDENEKAICEKMYRYYKKIKLIYRR